jgi:hypothetical protein
LLASPVLGPAGVLALTQPDADEEDRFDGSLVIWSIARDLHMLRRAYTKEK